MKCPTCKKDISQCPCENRKEQILFALRLIQEGFSRMHDLGYKIQETIEFDLIEESNDHQMTKVDGDK